MFLNDVRLWVTGFTVSKFWARIDAVDVSGQRVFIRVDFNVPQDKKEPFGSPLDPFQPLLEGSRRP